MEIDNVGEEAGKGGAGEVSSLNLLQLTAHHGRATGGEQWSWDHCIAGGPNAPKDLWCFGPDGTANYAGPGGAPLLNMKHAYDEWRHRNGV